jgi:hypothetical protein
MIHSCRMAIAVALAVHKDSEASTAVNRCSELAVESVLVAR